MQPTRLAVSAVALLALVGCSATATTTSAPAPAASQTGAPASSTSAPAPATTSTTTSTTTQPGTDIGDAGALMSKSLQAMQAKKTVEIEMSTSSSPTTLSMVMNFTPTGVNSSMKMGAMEIVTVDGVSYIKGAGAPAGKWLKAKGAPPTQSAPDLIKQTKAMSAGTMTKLETSGGVTHYRFSVPTAKYAEALGLPAGQLSSLGETYTMDYWLDADALPAKVSVTKPATLTMVYKNWGKAPVISAPPANLVVEG